MIVQYILTSRVGVRELEDSEDESDKPNGEGEVKEEVKPEASLEQTENKDSEKTEKTKAEGEEKSDAVKDEAIEEIKDLKDIKEGELQVKSAAEDSVPNSDISPVK